MIKKVDTSLINKLIKTFTVDSYFVKSEPVNKSRLKWVYKNLNLEEPKVNDQMKNHQIYYS